MVKVALNYSANIDFLVSKQPIVADYFYVPYRLYKNSNMPLLIKDNSKHKIYFEIYELTKEELEKLNYIYGKGFLYELEEIYLEEIDQVVYVYTYIRPFKRFLYDIISSGNFNLCIGCINNVKKRYNN